MAPLSLPDTQGLKCPTFRPPRQLLEQNKATLPEIYDWNGVHNPDHPLFVYDDDDEIRTITWSQAVRMIHRAARYIRDRSQLSSHDPFRLPVVGILASSDTITYLCTMIGIMRAGFTFFAISPRNSPEAVAHLLTKTETAFLLVSPESSTVTLAESASGIIQSTGGVSPKIDRMPVFEDLCAAVDDVSFDSYPTVAHDGESVAMIFHSSGSTAFPKPISWKHCNVLQRSWAPFGGRLDLAGVIVGWHVMPLYHGFGSLGVFLSASAGMILGVFKPRSPATLPTPDNFLKASLASKCDMICCVPSFLEHWVTVPESVAHLRTFKGVLFGGGPLSKHTGDSLVIQGVRVYLTFGLTECSVVNVFMPDFMGMDWQYLQIASLVPHEFVDQGQGLSELILMAGEHWRPQVFNSNHNGRDAYATGDLFLRHPTRPDFWKLYGRKDDQIVLSSGEKTNPGPLEAILSTDTKIKAAIIFGRGRFHNGVLVEPKPEYTFDPKDPTKLEEFKASIWSTIERMNEYAPQHSRIFKEMILVVAPSKPLQYTPKGTPRRQTILSDYENEINKIYESVGALQIDGPAIAEWTEVEITNFVRTVTTNVMGETCGDDDDIFQFGCDSLQASWIHSKIAGALRTFNIDAAASLPSNLVFREPTIAGMTRLLLQVADPSSSATPAGDHVSRVSELRDTAAKYTANFSARPQSLHPRPNDGDVVLVTGTTGGFGCNILAQLTRDPTVKKIYAFNRPSAGVNLESRQKDAMQKQGLLEDCTRSPKFELVEGDLSSSRLGLDLEVYEKLHTSVTHIMHNAWQVDFNLTLKSFEKNIKGVRNLIDFSLSSPSTEPPQILFVSSVGIFRRSGPQGGAGVPWKEEPLNDPTIAVGTGYAESKWIAEQILATASQQTGLRTVSVRIGQLCGDRNGHWNEKEWFPSIVKSAVYVGCLPDVTEPGLISWIPSYEGANAIAAMRNSTEPVLHLVNPNRIHFRVFLEAFARKLGVPLVSYDQWLSRLQESFEDSSLSEVEHMKRNPALRLLDYYRGRSLVDGRDMVLETTKSVQVAPSMLEMRLSPDMVDLWLESWRSSGFLPREQV